MGAGYRDARRYGEAVEGRWDRYVGVGELGELLSVGRSAKLHCKVKRFVGIWSYVGRGLMKVCDARVLCPTPTLLNNTPPLLNTEQYPTKLHDTLRLFTCVQLFTVLNKLRLVVSLRHRGALTYHSAEIRVNTCRYAASTNSGRECVVLFTL